METPGSLIDKIAIAELKLFHIAEQAGRADLAEDLRELSRERLQVMTAQRDDLLAELDALAERWNSGEYAPKVYRQFKLYNDPRFR